MTRCRNRIPNEIDDEGNILTVAPCPESARWWVWLDEWHQENPYCDEHARQRDGIPGVRRRPIVDRRRRIKVQVS